MKIELVELNDDDFEVVKEIYDYYVLNSTATFHTQLVAIEELKRVILISHPKYKSFLIKTIGEICGYCYLSQYKNRQAYDRTAEITIYLKNQFTGMGIGKATVQELEEIAKHNNIKVLIGIITGDNLVSINLFEKCGYQKCAHFREVGEKFNKLLDVVAYQKIIN